MADPVVDPQKFLLAVALVDWHAAARGDPRREEMAKISNKRPVAQLRWLLDPNIGYPTQPFEVYRRKALGVEIEKELPMDGPSIVFPTTFGWSCFATPRPMTFVRALVNVGVPQSNVVAFAGAPFASAIVDTVPVTSGSRTVTFTGPRISSLVVFNGVDLVAWWGTEPGTAVGAGWDRIEEVGLPVDLDAWAGVLDLDRKQGQEGYQTRPVDAALDRFARGGAPIGWPSAMTPSIAAPDWRQANPDMFLKAFGEDMLPQLREIVTTLPPMQHNSFTQNAQLAIDNGDPASATFSVLGAMSFAAATDPVASLLMGFGTAFEDDLVSSRKGEVPDSTLRSGYDYMVTATYRDGRDGRSDPVVYAAIALAPGSATRPNPPANLRIVGQGFRPPAQVDGPWRPINNLNWDRLPANVPLRSASFAHARAADGASPARALIGRRRMDSALQPIGASNAETDDSPPLLAASDDTFGLPGNPLTVALRYGVSHQDIFGLWSSWTAATINTAEPPVQKVPILSARLIAQAATGPCPATLTIDFSWDWQARRPAYIRFAGRLFGQANAGQAPPTTTVAAGLQKSLAGGNGTLFNVSFDADGAATPDAGGIITYLSDDGRDIVSGPTGSMGVRRYRLTITGFALDFASVGRIALQLWAMGVERRAPGRAGAWGTPATIASAADPRPPVINVQHENVLLASLADASGEHRVHLTWQAAPGATGYFIYTAEESKLRADYGLTEARLKQTLSQRLVELRNAFAANPARRFFTRLNGTAHALTSYEATLPRGSKDIHLFLVIGASTGNIESVWPDASDPLLRKRPIAYAAPRRVVPGALTLEVNRQSDTATGPDTYRADIRIETAPGARVDRIDLHRTANQAAALSVDDMGPPVLTLRLGQAGWTITPGPTDPTLMPQPLGTLQGPDRPAGRWHPLYYCAVAWSTDQLDRGVLGGRSVPSAVRSVIVPPAAPPVLQPIARQTPLGSASVTFVTSTPERAEKTPLGEHRLRVEVLGRTGTQPFAPLFTWPAQAERGKPPAERRLAAVPTDFAATGHGLRRIASTSGTQLQLRVERATAKTELKLRIQLDDPLGRSTERILDVPPDPSILAPKFGPIKIGVRASGRHVVTAPTNLPMRTTAEAGYELEYSFQPWMVVGSRLVPVVGADISGTIGYPAILPVELVPNKNPPGNSGLTIRRAPTAAGTTDLLFTVPGSGWLSAKLRAADGGNDAFNVKVGRDPTILGPVFGAMRMRSIGRHVYEVTVPVNLPMQVDETAGYQVKASFRPGFADGPMFVAAGKGRSSTAAYSAVPVLQLGETPLIGTSRLAIRRVEQAGGKVAIACYVSGNGKLRIDLADANGGLATLNVDLS